MVRFYKPWTIFWESFLLVPALLLLFYLMDVHGGREDGPSLSIRYCVQAFLGSALAMNTHERGFNPSSSSTHTWIDNIKLYKVTKKGLLGLLRICFSDREFTKLIQGPRLNPA